MFKKFFPTLLIFLCLSVGNPCVGQGTLPAPEKGTSPRLEAPKEVPPADGEKKAVPSLRKMLFSTAVLTVLLLVMVFVLKAFRPRTAGELPREAFEILGRASLAYRQQLYYLRCGNRLFVVSLSPNGLDRVGEITDPAEVDRLTRLCHGDVLGSRAVSRNPSAQAEAAPTTFDNIYRQVVTK
ncbi:MAG: hypothetical protein Q4D98_05040 [Planctomycetia bacterium]|nr:hypothetical protein [Planctomycetia bacterium]